MYLRLKLIAVFVASTACTITLADEGGFHQHWARMIYVEDTIREIDSSLSRLEKSLLDLQFPTASARSLFDAEVLLADLHTANSHGDVLLSAKSTSWKVSIGKKVPREYLRIWQPYLRSLQYLKHCDFAVIDGQFSDSAKLHFVAEVGFSGLGQSSQGLSHAKAKVAITFVRENIAASDWRVASWKTKSFDTQNRSGLMFQDVLDEVLPQEIASELRRSKHEEVVARILKNSEQKKKTRPFPAFDMSSWMRHPGLSVTDYDSDGFDDLFVTRRTGDNRLLRNRGDGTFEDATDGTALTTDCEEGFTNAALFADFDNDGDQDVFVGRSLRASRFYRNDGGTFVYSPESISIPLPPHVVSISAVDYNNDGLLDVYMSRYMAETNGFNLERNALKKRETISKLYKANRELLPKAEAREFAHRTWKARANLFRDAPGVPNLLLKNIGNGRFVPAPEGKALEVWRPTYQATWADYDNDGDADVYVANDFSPNHLFRNDDGKFVDVTAATETADNGFGMGASWGDYDGDGQLDLYVTNMSSKAGRRITKAMGPFGDRFAALARGNSLFRQSDGKFIRVSGTTADKLPVELAGWGWGGQFVDIDNDSDLDIFAPSGYYTAPAQVRNAVDT